MRPSFELPCGLEGYHDQQKGYRQTKLLDPTLKTIYIHDMIFAMLVQPTECLLGTELLRAPSALLLPCSMLLFRLPKREFREQRGWETDERELLRQSCSENGGGVSLVEALSMRRFAGFPRSEDAESLAELARHWWKRNWILVV